MCYNKAIKQEGVLNMTQTYLVPTATIVSMVVSLAAGLIIPAVLYLIVRKFWGGKKLPFFIGCASMLVFAFVLEQLLHALVLSLPIGVTLQSNIWLYALYGGFAAGLFEETGRFVAFSTILKRHRDDDANALMYGAGHGGFEAFYILGVGMVSNLVLSIMLNRGMVGVLTMGVPADMLPTVEATFAQLANTPSWMFLVGIFERISAVCGHLAMSVFVWFAVKNKKWYLYPFSILCHALLNIVAVVVNSVAPVWVTEALIFLCAMILVLIASRIWKRNTGALAE